MARARPAPLWQAACGVSLLGSVAPAVSQALPTLSLKCPGPGGRKQQLEEGLVA